MDEQKPAVRTLVLVYGLLLAFAGLTTAVSFVDLGAWSLAVSLIVAGAKALLVALFFMHLRYGSRLNAVIAGVGLYMLGILFILTLNDVLTRSWLSPFLGGAP